MKKECLGIYIESNEIRVAHFKGKKQGNLKEAIQIDPPLTGLPPLEQLRRLLGTIQPSRKRRITIVIPRHHFFIREIPLESLSPSEAKASVKMSLSLHSHLPEDEIVYDIFCVVREEKTFAILIYIPKQKVQPIVDMFKETGHRKSLHAIVPPSVALDTATREIAPIKEPHLALFKDEKGYVLSLHGQESWEGAFRLNGEALDQEGLYRVLASLPKEWEARSTRLYSPFPPEDVGGHSIELHPLMSKISEENGEGLLDHFSFHALTGAITSCSFPPISVHGPRKRPIKINISPFHIGLLVTAVGMIWLSVPTYNKYVEIQKGLNTLREEVAAKKKALIPLREKGKRLKEIQKKISEIKGFTDEFPGILEVLDELARLTPDEAWIKTFNLTGHTIRLSAEGPSAVNIMSQWRTSKLFEEVRLVSPVTKSRQGNERFSVEIRLRVNKL